MSTNKKNFNIKYRVHQGFGMNIGKRRKVIFLWLLLTTLRQFFGLLGHYLKLALA